MKHPILIAGTFHMAGSDDWHISTQGNIPGGVKQRELAELRARLARFRPTRIAVEWEPKYQALVDRQFRAYCENALELTENEIYQIAFPLAKELGLSGVSCVDWMEQGVGLRGYSDVYDYAREKEPKLYAELEALSIPPDLSEMTVTEAFRAVNSREAEARSSALYVNLARVGTEEEHYGLGWLMWWYQRNLILFANLSRLVSGEKEERVLLLIGGSHKGILSGFLRDSQLFEVVDTLEYLS